MCVGATARAITCVFVVGIGVVCHDAVVVVGGADVLEVERPVEIAKESCWEPSIIADAPSAHTWISDKWCQ